MRVYDALRMIGLVSRDYNGIEAIYNSLRDRRTMLVSDPGEYKTSAIYDCGYTIMQELDNGALLPPGRCVTANNYYAVIYVHNDSVMMWLSRADYPKIHRDSNGRVLSTEVWMEAWRVTSQGAVDMFYDNEKHLRSVSDVIEEFETAAKGGVTVVT